MREPQLGLEFRGGRLGTRRRPAQRYLERIPTVTHSASYTPSMLDLDPHHNTSPPPASVHKHIHQPIFIAQETYRRQLMRLEQVGEWL
jgi:hypothetical protein